MTGLIFQAQDISVYHQINFGDILTLKIAMVTSLFQNRKLNQAYLDDLGDTHSIKTIQLLTKPLRDKNREVLDTVFKPSNT